MTMMHWGAGKADRHPRPQTSNTPRAFRGGVTAPALLPVQTPLARSSFLDDQCTSTFRMWINPAALIVIMHLGGAHQPNLTFGSNALHPQDVTQEIQSTALSVAADHEQAPEGATPFGGDDAERPQNYEAAHRGVGPPGRRPLALFEQSTRSLFRCPSLRGCTRSRYLPGRRYLEMRHRRSGTGLVTATHSGACFVPFADVAGQYPAAERPVFLRISELSAGHEPSGRPLWPCDSGAAQGASFIQAWGRV